MVTGYSGGKCPHQSKSTACSAFSPFSRHSPTLLTRSHHSSHELCRYWVLVTTFIKIKDSAIYLMVSAGEPLQTFNLDSPRTAPPTLSSQFQFWDHTRTSMFSKPKSQRKLRYSLWPCKHAILPFLFWFKDTCLVVTSHSSRQKSRSKTPSFSLPT